MPEEDAEYEVPADLWRISRTIRRGWKKKRKILYSYANEKLVTELLDVLDNFERALEQETSDETASKKGMEMIFKQLSDVLEEVRSGRDPGAGGGIRPEFPQRCDD